MGSPHVVAKGLLKNSTFVRHAGRIALVLFIALFLLLTSWLILSPRFWSSAQPLAKFVIQHRQLIRLFAAIMAITCALFFFWPPEGRRLVGRWSDYVGLTFMLIFAQYGLRYVELALGNSVDPKAANVIHLLSNAVIYVCSGLSNLLILAAARILLNKRKRIQEVQELKDDHRILTQSKYRFINSFTEFRGVISVWAWILACMSPLALLDANPNFLWARFPDALFSAYCLGWLGYATAINFNVRRRATLAILALVAVLGYGAGQLAYAANPIIAYTARTASNEISSYPLAWIRKTMGGNVNDLVGSLNQTTGRDDTALEFLDNAVYAVMLPMRFILFLPVFFLYLLFIISVNDFRRALGETTSRRKDYLSADGIVRAIGESLGADRVSLFIRIPGAEVERVLPLVWDSEGIYLSTKRREVFSIEDNPLLLRVMKVEGEEIFAKSENRGVSRAKFLSSSFGPEFLALVPIKLHGGVIGVLQADLRGYGKFNHTTLQKLRLMATLIAPSVQDLRALAAVDQIGFRFTRLQVDYPDDHFEQAIMRMIDILHDVLSPLATGLIIEIGFFSIKQIRSNNDTYRRLLEEQDIRWMGIDEELQIVRDNENIRLEKSQMLIRASNSTKDVSPLGSLMLAIPAEKDEFSHPTLAAYYLIRKTVTSLIADGVLDLARNSLGGIIKDLGVKFSMEALSREEWLEEIGDAARRAGLLWVVASDHNNINMQGDREAIESILALSEEDKTTFFDQPLVSLISRPQKFPASHIMQKFSTSHIIRLNLPKSEHQLWFGLERPSFGQELDFQSPWKVFFNDLSAVADMALESLQNRQEAEIERVKAAQSQGILTIAVTTGTLMHQLINMIRDQLFATESLEEALGDVGIKLDTTSSKLLGAMKRSAIQMRELTEAFKSVTKMDERRPCSIKEVAEQATQLYQVSLMQRKVEVKISVPPEIKADIPFHVVAFALANLIGNAKDAIKSHGKIEIDAEENDKFILCHVTNNGPEIPAEALDKVFNFGVSGKEGHNGWGLYFVNRALKENGGSIELTSNPNETSFTMRLPKSRQY